MLRMKPDPPDPIRVALRFRLAGPDFLGTAARDASEPVTDLSYKATKKIIALERGALPSLGADPKDQAFSGASTYFGIDASPSGTPPIGAIFRE